MRRGWLALPILVCAAACSPLRDYQEASRGLRFHLDRVEPKVHVTLPVDRSRIAFKVVLGVDNPSQVPFHVLGFAGDLKLEHRGTLRPIGRLELASPIDLPAAGTGRLETELSFSYSDLRDNWVAIEAMARGGSGTWRLEGSLKVEAYGIRFQIPVRSSRALGSGE